MPNEATFSIVIFSSSAAATSFSPACRLPKKGSEKPAPSPESFIEMSGFEEAAADRARARRSGARAAGANASARGSTAATRIAHRSIARFRHELRRVSQQLNRYTTLATEELLTASFNQKHFASFLPNRTPI